MTERALCRSILALNDSCDQLQNEETNDAIRYARRLLRNIDIPVESTIEIRVPFAPHGFIDEEGTGNSKTGG